MSLNGCVAGILDAGGKVESLVLGAMGPIVGYADPPEGACIKVKTPRFVGVINLDGGTAIELVKKSNGSYVLRNAAAYCEWLTLPMPIEGGVVVATNKTEVTP